MNDEQVDRIVVALERTAKANERLIELATEERDTGDSIFGPPFCPHCGAFNPSVANEGGTGAMAEFVLIATCGNCSKVFYAFPQGWLAFQTKDEARQEMEGRKQR
jgi:hypothetical protein